MEGGNRGEIWKKEMKEAEAATFDGDRNHLKGKFN